MVENSNYPKISKKGMVFAFLVLVFNGTQSVVSNLRPSELDTLLYTFAVIALEFFFMILVYAIGLIFTKYRSKNISEPQKIQETEHNLSKLNIIVRLLLIGVIFSVSTYVVFLGYQSVDNVTGSIAVKSQPISMLLIGYFFLKERVTMKEIICAGIMLLSVYYISTKGTMLLGEFSTGIIYLLIAPVMWNVGHSITKKLLVCNILTVPQLILARLGLSGIFTAILYLIVNRGGNLLSFNRPGYLGPILAMTFVYLILHLTWYRTIKEIDVSLATSIIIPAPVVTAFLAYFAVNDPIYYYHYIGLFGTLIGLYGLLFFKSKKKIQD